MGFLPEAQLKVFTEMLGKELKDASKLDIMKMVERIERMDRSDRTKEDYKILIRKFFRWLGKSEIVDWMEMLHNIDDALGLCAGMASFCLKPPYHINNYPKIISAASGMDVDRDELQRKVNRSRNLHRAVTIEAKVAEVAATIRTLSQASTITLDGEDALV